MNTPELVRFLATGEQHTAPLRPQGRIALAAAAGAALALPLMWSWLGFNPELARAAALPMFWVKFVFVAALVGGAALLAVRLARPGVRLARAPLIAALPVVAMWLLAALALLGAAPEARPGLLMGVSWSVCPLNILVLSIPALGLTLWAMRSLAPTRLRAAGAAAGLSAGAVGALVYTLHCPELAAPFLGLWYVIGMLATTLLGAAVGPRVLSW